MSLFTIIWRFVEKKSEDTQVGNASDREKNRDKSFHHRENCFCPLAFFLNENHFNRCNGLIQVCQWWFHCFHLLIVLDKCCLGNHFQRGKKTFYQNCLLQDYPRRGAGRAKIAKKERKNYQQIAIWRIHFKVQSEVKPEQAWTPTEKEHTKVNSATMLGAIGELSS